MDNKTLLYLLKGGHLSMPERIERGIWPHPPLSLNNLIEFLAKTIEEGERWFPCQWSDHNSGEPVREGGNIERQQTNRYLYRASRHHPLSPTTLAETTETVFSSSRDAAIHYLKWDMNLPGDLDGWKVVE